jgi:hypothetical protein
LRPIRRFRHQGLTNPVASAIAIKTMMPKSASAAPST